MKRGRAILYLILEPIPIGSERGVSVAFELFDKGDTNVPKVNRWPKQRQAAILSKYMLLLSLVFLTTGCSLLRRADDMAAVELTYKAPVIPIEISVNTWGEIDIKTTSGISVPTPVGVFGANLVTDSQHVMQSFDNVLIIRIDDRECVYDMHGHSIKFEGVEGQFQIVSVETDGDGDVTIVLKGDHYTGCTQEWTNVSVAGAAGASGHEAGCSGASPSYLNVGDAAYISVFQASVLKEPSEFASFAKYKYLDGGRTVTIIDGPVCGPGNPGHVLFWKVRSEVIRFVDGTSDAVEGWVAEESGDIYLLRPMKQSRSEPSL